MSTAAGEAGATAVLSAAVGNSPEDMRPLRGLQEEAGGPLSRSEETSLGEKEATWSGRRPPGQQQSYKYCKIKRECRLFSEFHIL